MSGMGDIFSLLRNAKQMAEKAKEAQVELAKKTAAGTAGAGMVNATVNGTGELVGLNIDKSVIDPEDPEMLADLVIAAVADARKKAGDLRKESLSELTGGIDLSSFGLDLNGLF